MTKRPIGFNLPALSIAPITALIIAFPFPVLALSLVTNRTDLKANDRLDWSVLGPIQPPLPFKILGNSFSTTSEAGLGVMVDIPTPPPVFPPITPPFLFQTSSAIPSNFADGDFILFSGFTPGLFPSPGNPGPLTLSFDTPVFAAGAQISVDDTTNFTAFISAFDENNNLLGTFSAEGTSSLELDNTALFLGLRNNSANISKLVFSTSISDRAIGINTLSIGTTQVPEPSLVVALSALAVSICFSQKNKLNKKL